jgi:hypothetical protein
MDDSPPLCPLCDRPITKGARSSIHHLIPRLKGGRGGPVVRLHDIRHRKIHATFTETDLARHHSSVEALRAHPEIAAFVAWLRSRPPEFHARTAGPRRGGRR